MVGLIGGGSSSPYQIPSYPKSSGVVARNQEKARRIPHTGGTLVDEIQFPTSWAGSQAFSAYLDDVLVWSVTASAAVTLASIDGNFGLHCHWYDSINDRLYVFSYEYGTMKICVSYITVETGAITEVNGAGVILASNPAGYNTAYTTTVSRSAEDSGNFRFTNSSQYFEISSTDGSLVTDVTAVDETEVTTLGGYKTSDGWFVYAITTTYVMFGKDGYQVTCPLPTGMVCAGTFYPQQWGNQVALWTTSANGQFISQVVSKTDFDKWINDISILRNGS